jgi:hypothetical protein
MDQFWHIDTGRCCLPPPMPVTTVTVFSACCGIVVPRFNAKRPSMAPASELT